MLEQNRCLESFLKSLSILFLLSLTTCMNLPWGDANFDEGYTITSFYDPDGNAIICEKRKADAGKKILAAIKLADGFALDYAVVTTSNGVSIPLNYDFAPYITFVMPSDNVTITGYFEVPPEFPPMPNPLPAGMAAALLVDAEAEEPYQFFGTLQEALDAATGGTIDAPKYVFPLCDIEQTETILIWKHVALYTQGESAHKIFRGSSFRESLLKIAPGGSLVLGAAAGSSLAIDGGANWGGSAPANGATNTGLTADEALIAVTGTLTLNKGAVVQNNHVDVIAQGGGVYVYGSNAVLTVKGGKICNNSTSVSNAANCGGGVFLAGAAQLTLSSGEISGNYGAHIGGGVCVSDGSIFTMAHGEVNNNKTGNDGGGIALEGGKFAMTGGTVSNNFAATSGGGISAYFSATVEISGGSISSNKARTLGGGIRLCENIYSDMTNPTILNLSGGEITGNTVSESPYKGQGVCTDTSSSVIVKINMSANAFINANNDVYLAYPNYITITGELTSQKYPVAQITPEDYMSSWGVLYLFGSYNFTQDDINKLTVTDNSSGDKYGINSMGISRGFIRPKTVSLTVNGQTNYYASIAEAVGDAAAPGTTSLTNPAVITVLKDIEQTTGVAILDGIHISLTVPEGEDYCVKRATGNTGHLFTVGYDSTNNILSSLVLGAPEGSSLTIDGAAEWVGGTTTPPDPAHGAASSPFAYAALIKAEGILTLNEGAVLQNNNNATGSGDGNGGGVYIDGSSAVFNMTGGKIRNNSVTHSTGRGGAVFIDNGARFTMTGGEISGNYASTYGGGVCMMGSVFNMKGNALLNQDNDVYLHNAQHITITGTLSQNPAANIKLSTSFTTGTQVLGGDIATNYNKFRVNGQAGKIDTNGQYAP
ncbi:MAG: hypothetical protein Ta2F_08950 [Termitinemataceae bacterium]|nr:MAG: hypothetical protein Ta2F_08950 [Termitinemataceae bacterium]